MNAHPLADIFPLMQGDEFAALVEDIRQHGVREPIVTMGGLILDGRNRFRASQEAGVECPAREYEGDDPAAFVVSLNLKRRHLDESQRAMVAARLANLGVGRPADNSANLRLFAEPETPRVTTEQAAALLNVGERTVEHARVVVREAVPELAAKVEAGSVSVSAAAEVARLPKPEQGEVVARGEREILEKAKEIRAAKAEARREEIALVKARPVAIPSGLYETLVVDPPWPMEKIERDVRPNQVAFDYPTMSEDELSAFTLPAAESSHLFLWTTHKFLPMAFRLLERWGFRYVCAFVWHKPGGFQPIGLPQYNCEFALYARKGSPSFVETKAFPTCFQAPRAEHSRKPDEFYDVVRRVTSGPRIDVFSRERRDGFDQFGNEADKFSGAA